MNSEILFVLKAERNAADLRQSGQSIENNWFVQLQRKLSAKTARSNMDPCGCSGSAEHSIEQTR